MKKQEQPRTFPVIVQKEPGGGYTVSNPAFEGCYSQGETLEEALANIREATELCLEEAAEHGRETAPTITSNDVSLHLITI